LAYRVDVAYLTGSGCNEPGPGRDADCVLNVDRYLVTPFGTLPWDDQPTWSPDASRIGFTNGLDIFTLDVSGNVVNLTNSGTYQVTIDPAWSPDGTQIVFGRGASAATDLYLVNTDGTGLRRLTNGFALHVAHPTWSPDSARI